MLDAREPDLNQPFLTIQARMTVNALVECGAGSAEDIFERYIAETLTGDQSANQAICLENLMSVATIDEKAYLRNTLAASYPHLFQGRNFTAQPGETVVSGIINDRRDKYWFLD